MKIIFSSGGGCRVGGSDEGGVLVVAKMQSVVLVVLMITVVWAVALMVVVNLVRQECHGWCFFFVGSMVMLGGCGVGGSGDDVLL